MTIGVVSGFAPAQPSQPASAGMTGKAAAPADGPFGMFDAILSMFQAVPSAAGAAETAVAGSSFEPVAKSGIDAALAVLTGQGQQPQVAQSEVAGSEAASTAAARPMPDVLRDLIDKLTALQEGLGDSAPLDTLAEKDIEDTLAALAAALGIELPASAPVEAVQTPVTSAAAPVAALDPLAAIETPQVAPATASAIDVAAAGAILPADGDSPIVATATPLVGEAPATPEAAQPVPPVVEKLAQKLAELAEALAPRAPELAKKLEAFASKLVAGEVTAADFAKLGLDPAAQTANVDLTAAIERLLAPRAEAKPAAQPTPFAAATLMLPDLGTSETSDKPKAVTEPRRTSSEPSSEPVEDNYDAPPSARTAAADRLEKPEPQPAARNSFNAAFQASLNAPDNTAAQSTLPAGVAVVGTAVAADTRAIHAAYRAPVQQINMPQMAVEIVRQVEAGNSRFQIRLDPPELGRIDVKLDVDKAGNVNARLTVERAETLDLMQRDQRSLEKALAQAGLDSSKTNLEFSLRQNPFGRDGQPQQQGGNGQPAFPRFGVAEADDAIPAPHISAYRGYASASGVNLFV